jgi:hypothetical protein
MRMPLAQVNQNARFGARAPFIPHDLAYPSRKLRCGCVKHSIVKFNRARQAPLRN